MKLESDPEFVKEIEEALEQYEQQIGLNKLNKVEEPECLRMKISDLRKKIAEDLVEYTYQINQYSMYIQRLINKNKAWVNWAKAKLDELCASYIPDVPQGYGFNERILMARHNPPICKKINEFLRRIQMQVDRLYDIPKNLNIMADTIKDLKFAALRREKDNKDNNYE